MQWRNSEARYGALAMAFHWAIFLLVLVQFALGIVGAQLAPGFDKLVTLARHKSIGLSIFALVALRLGWRLISPPPPLPADMQRGQRRLAHASHALLYVLLFALPISGWLFSSASGISVSWFGIVALPDLVQPSKPLAQALVRVHAGLAIALALLVSMHVSAAIWHHAVRRDDVLRRMLPGGKARRTSP
jgi:cytochrome b561